MNRVTRKLSILLGVVFWFTSPLIHALEIGDLVYCQGVVGVFPDEEVGLKIGHVGVYIGYYDGDSVQMVVEAMPVGVSKVSFATFVTRKPYFGNRTASSAPEADQRRRICLFAKNRLGLSYDYNHSSQKGPTKYDCVGLSEAVYEMVGLNPTPDNLESGSGWPLTPKEQYSNTVVSLSANPTISIWDVTNSVEVNGAVTSSSNLLARVTDGDHGSGLWLFTILKDNPISGQEVFRSDTHYEYDDGDFVDGFGNKWKTYSIPTGLSDGTYYSKVFDRADGYTSVAFTIDTTAPTETDSSVDENEIFDISNPEIFFEFSEPVELVSLTIDGLNQSSNVSINGNRVNIHFNFTSGQHTLVLVVKDRAGNEIIITRHFTTNDGNNDKLKIIGLGVSNIQRDSAKIKWQTYKGTTAVVTDGVVYYGTSHGNLNSSVVDSGSGSSHEVSLTGLNEGTDYFFKAASSGGGESAVSDTDTFKTLGPGQGSFTWNLSADAVERYTGMVEGMICPIDRKWLNSNNQGRL